MTVGGLSSRADRLHRKLANIEARRGIVERADADKTKEAQDKRKRLERFAGGSCAAIDPQKDSRPFGTHRERIAIIPHNERMSMLRRGLE